MSGVSVVLFDVGSTLVDGPPEAPARRIARRLGFSEDVRRRLDEGLLTRPFGGPDEVVGFLRDELGQGGPGAEDAVGEVWAAQHTEARPIPGAEDAVQGLAAAGLRIGIVSNIWWPYLQASRLAVPAVFHELADPALQFFSFRERTAKPAPAIYERALSAAAVPAGAVVMVGDSYARDVRPAQDLGMATVWVFHRPDRETGHRQRVQVGEMPAPSRTIEDVTELTVDLVRSLGVDDGAGRQDGRRAREGTAWN